MGTCNTAGTDVVAEAAAVVVAVAVVAPQTAPEAQTSLLTSSTHNNVNNPRICSAQHHSNFFNVEMCPHKMKRPRMQHPTS